MTDKLLFGMGNPLLDISAEVGLDLLKKYDLKENDAILVEEKHLPLYDEMVDNYKVDYIPGGATQNTIKVAQWVLKKKYASVYVGCIKDDKYGKKLNESCEKIGVRTLYQYNKGPESTGICACLITGHNRSLVTSLGAACKFTVDHLDKSEIWKYVEQSGVFYISSFFITSCHEALIKVAKHSMENNKIFCLNLGAEFLVEFFNSQVTEAIEYSNVVFGNEAEATKFAQIKEFGTNDIKEIAIKMSKMPSKIPNKHRTIVITQGADPTIIVHEGELKLFPINPIEKGKIVDTIGAGDAFVGGFLVQLLHGKSLEECVRCANWTAGAIIQQAGCTFPDECCFD